MLFPAPSRCAIVSLLITSTLLLTHPALAHPVNPTPTSPQTLSPAPIPSDRLRAILLQARDAWVSGDAAAFAALFTADGELVVPGQRWSSPAAIEMESANFLQSFNVTIEIQSILVEGNRAAIAWQWRETQKETGQTRLTDDVILVEFAGDRIRRWREYIDAETPNSQP